MGYLGHGYSALGWVYLVLWFFGSSALLFYTWNLVVCQQYKMKKVKFWQALLVVGTLTVFCIPKKMFRNCGGHSGGECPHMSKMPHS